MISTIVRLFGRGMSYVGIALVVVESVQLLTVSVKWLKAIRVLGSGKVKLFWKSIVKVDDERTASSTLGAPLRFLWFWTLLISITLIAWRMTAFVFFPWLAAYWLLLTINRIADRACPPVILLLAASDQQSIGRFRHLKNWAGPLRIVCLLDIDVADQVNSFAMKVEGVGSTLLPDLLRTQSGEDWRRIARELMGIVAIILIDVTRPSANLNEELQYVDASGFRWKVKYFAQELAAGLETFRVMNVDIDPREVMTLETVVETLDKEVGDRSSTGLLGRSSSVLIAIAVLAELVLIVTGILPLLRVAQAVVLRRRRSP